MKLIDKFNEIKKEIDSYDFSKYNSKGILKNAIKEFKSMFKNIKDDFNQRLDDCMILDDSVMNGEPPLVDWKEYNELPDDEKKHIEVSCQYHSIRMNPLEYYRMMLFEEWHTKHCHNMYNGKSTKNKVPVTFTYQVEQTGIGVGIIVICNNCKTKLDVTDYGSW